MNSTDMGHMGGKARAASLSPERRKAIAQQAATARWQGHVKVARRSKMRMRERLRIATEALNKIAGWNEGDTVGTHFDEPASAQEARDALLKIT